MEAPEKSDDDELGSWISKEELERYSAKLRKRPWGKPKPEVKYDWVDPGVGGPYGVVDRDEIDELIRKVKAIKK